MVTLWRDCKNHLAGTTYTCVDSHPDTLQGGSTYKGGKLFYPVEAHCGSLKCPPLCVPFVQKNKMLNFEKITRMISRIFVLICLRDVIFHALKN